MKKTILIVFVLVLSGVLGFVFSFYEHPTNRDALLPSGDVKVIETFHSPAIFVKQLEGDPRAGQKIFTEFCATCHSRVPLIDIRAPHIGDKKAWDKRRKMGMNNLLNITIQGVGAMPARGGCFECSDEQLKVTIEYMLSQR